MFLYWGVGVEGLIFRFSDKNSLFLAIYDIFFHFMHAKGLKKASLRVSEGIVCFFQFLNEKSPHLLSVLETPINTETHAIIGL